MIEYVYDTAHQAGLGVKASIVYDLGAALIMYS